MFASKNCFLKINGLKSILNKRFLLINLIGAQGNNKIIKSNQSYNLSGLDIWRFYRLRGSKFRVTKHNRLLLVE